MYGKKKITKRRLANIMNQKYEALDFIIEEEMNDLDNESIKNAVLKSFKLI